MRIAKITVNNYKQFIHTTLDLDNEITVLAGPNNSGKTGIISLIKKIILGTKEKFDLTYLPFPIINKFNTFLRKTIKEYFEKGFKIDDYENEFGNKLEKFILDEKVQTYVDFTIFYEKEENIELFSDYFMDLEDSMQSFFFRYKFEFDLAYFETEFTLHLSRYFELLNGDYENNIKNVLNSIMDYLILSVKENAYYCNNNFSLINKMDSLSEFRSLFCFESIQAGRPLDDDIMDNNHGLSKGMLEIAGMDDEWNEELEKVVEDLKEIISQRKINDMIKNSSLRVLEEILNNIGETTGNSKTHLQLETNANNEELNNFLQNIISAVYDMDGINLNESSQGLGFSNLIYLHIKLVKYKKTIDEKKVNFYIIEEPESHMHPQMQRAFICFLFEDFKANKLQGMISTHSNEVVRQSKVRNIRVIRKFSFELKESDNIKKYNESRIVNLESLVNIDENSSDEEKQLSSFFDFFFDIGYSEMIFADIAILYEGDTERMLIEYAIKELFPDLAKRYIAFVQVGGSYAYNYKELITLLNIRTLIITDIDYEKEIVDIEKILNSKSSNSSIIKFYKDSNSISDDLKIRDLYKWKKEEKNKLYNDLIFVNFQSEKDSYGRTLEESMICKKFGLNVSQTRTLKEWKEDRDSTKLVFSIPRGSDDLNDKVGVRDILKSSSGSKTDFMCSVIINKYVKEMLPTYIYEGLKWLME